MNPPKSASRACDVVSALPGHGGGTADVPAWFGSDREARAAAGRGVVYGSHDRRYSLDARLQRYSCKMRLDPSL